MIRFRLGNEMKESRYWEENQRLHCRLCGGEKKTWKHASERCREWRERQETCQEALGWVLGEERESEW